MSLYEGLLSEVLEAGSDHLVRGKMLTIDLNKEGTCIPDHLSEKVARETWEACKDSDMTLSVSTISLWDAYRMLIAEDVIPVEKIKLTILGYDVEVNRYGATNIWDLPREADDLWLIVSNHAERTLQAAMKKMYIERQTKKPTRA
jgi:hypothetical protein